MVRNYLVHSEKEIRQLLRRVKQKFSGMQRLGKELLVKSGSLKKGNTLLLSGISLKTAETNSFTLDGKADNLDGTKAD